MSKAKELTHCRACGHREFASLIDFGNMPVLGFPWPGNAIKFPIVPLALVSCVSCGLVQTSHTAPPAWLYTEYWYRSGTNETMVAELRDVVRHAVELAEMTRPIAPDDCVVDIGANDGTLLAQYPDYCDAIRIGVEPAANLLDELRQHATITINDYFPDANGVIPKQARIVTTIAMLYDLPDVGRFITGIQKLLAPDGVWIAEFQDLCHLMSRTGFDMICHEHLEIYSVIGLQKILSLYGLIITDAFPRAINGGSVRVVIRHQKLGAPVQDRVMGYMRAEYLMGLSPDPAHLQASFRNLALRIIALKTQVRALLRGQSVVDCYGASTKGHTLLHLFEIDHTQIRQAIERSPQKVGRLYGSSAIPIVDEGTARVDPAPLWLMPLWQFKAGILAREASYLKHGGAMLFPLPNVEVVCA